MLKNIAFSSLITLLFIVSCKDSPKRLGKEDNEFKPKMGFLPIEYGQSFEEGKEERTKKLVGEGAVKMNEIPMNQTILSQWQEKAMAEINEISQKTNNKSYASFTNNLWIVDAIYVDQFADRSVHDGTWIDFNDDLTYEYGRYNDKLGDGKYFYNPEIEGLTLFDNDSNNKPFEFEVGWDMGFVVIAGTKKYGDNLVMVKLINKADKPTK
jgi:hypothetical protein